MATLPVQPGSAPANAPVHLLAHEVSTAIQRHKIAPTTFGWKALRDPQFVADLLRRGRNPRPATAEKVRAFIASLEPKTNTAQQPGLRSFIVYDRLPEGLQSHKMSDGGAQPHIRQGEAAVIDPTQREPIPGELFLIQFKGAYADEAHLHRKIVEVRELWGGYAVAQVRPQELLNVATGEPMPGEKVRFWDGPYPADYLEQKMLLGRVVGILAEGR